MRKRKAGKVTGLRRTVRGQFSDTYLDNDVIHLADHRKRVGEYTAPEYFVGGSVAGEGIPMPVPLFAIADRQKQRVLRRQRIVLAGAAFAAGAALAHTMGRFVDKRVG